MSKIDLDAIKKRRHRLRPVPFGPDSRVLQAVRNDLDVLVAEVESLSHAASAEADMADEFKRERDQLRAENERLKGACDYKDKEYNRLVGLWEDQGNAALAKLQTCREALDNAQDVLRILYHTTEGRAAEKAHECTRKIDKALEASK